MNERSKIKIVKKADAAELKVRKRKRDIPRDAAREMVSTVSDWVTDLKARKSAETKAAFDIFLPSSTRPSES